MKAIILSATLAILIMTAGCGIEAAGSGATSAPDTSGESITVGTMEAEKQDYEVKILSAVIGKDYKDEPILVVEYEFLNNTDKAQSFAFSLEDKAYQNGVACSDVIFSDDIETEQELTDIKPGVAYKLKIGYKLQDMETPVEIEVTELFGEKPVLAQTVEIK